MRVVAQDRFQFVLHENEHATEDDKDYIFTAEYNGDAYTVSFQGESVDYTEDEVDQYLAEGFWELV